MHLAAYQVILITVYAFIAINDSLISNTLTQPAIAGMISGMIMGDLKTGLMVGGTLQLMRLGIAAKGITVTAQLVPNEPSIDFMKKLRG